VEEAGCFFEGTDRAGITRFQILFDMKEFEGDKKKRQSHANAKKKQVILLLFIRNHTLLLKVISYYTTKLEKSLVYCPVILLD